LTIDFEGRRSGFGDDSGELMYLFAYFEALSISIPHKKETEKNKKRKENNSDAFIRVQAKLMAENSKRDKRYLQHSSRQRLRSGLLRCRLGFL
jgi:hypothetical protein